MTREYTSKLLDAIEQGLLSPQAVVEMALTYMSEDEVHDMMRVNDLLYYLDAEDEEEDVDCDDSDDGYALASAGFGTDEDYGYYGDE